jgi:hypothetical protein
VGVGFYQSFSFEFQGGKPFRLVPDGFQLARGGLAIGFEGDELCPEFVKVHEALSYHILVAGAFGVYIGKSFGPGAHLTFRIAVALLLYVSLYASVQALGLFE